MLPAHNRVLLGVDFIYNLRLILNLGHICFLVLLCARDYQLTNLLWFENGQVNYSKVSCFLSVIVPKVLKAFNRVFVDLHTVSLVRFD